MKRDDTVAIATVQGRGVLSPARTVLGLMLLACGPGVVHAAITVTNSVFPAVGGTLRYAEDSNPGPQISVGAPGFNLSWDFSSLQRNSSWQYAMRDASTGASAAAFPDATLVYDQQGHPTTRLPGSQATEAYLQVTAGQVNLLGFGGSDALLLGFNHTSAFSGGGPILRWAPTNFFDIKAVSSGFMQEIPKRVSLELDQTFEQVVSTFEKYRITSSFQMVSFIDGFGTLTIPGGTFDVLRVHDTVSHLETSLDLYVPPLGWLPADSLTNSFAELFPIADVIPDLQAVLDALSADQRQLFPTTWMNVPFSYHSYSFIDAESTEVLATVNYAMLPEILGQGLQSTVVESVQFKDLGDTSPVPLPAAAWLFSSGLAGFIGLSRRKLAA